MKFQAAARAIRGSKDVQEDAYRVFDAKGGDAGEIAGSDAGVALSGGGLVLVADGIGGHYGGDIASAITADTFARTFFAGSGGVEEKLRTSLAAANNAIAEAQAKEPNLKDMGATLVTGFLENGEMTFISVGDSLILRYRDGELHRVNMDHSYMEIADREALGSDDRNLWRDVMTRKGRDSITIAVLGRALEDFGHVPQIATRKILPGDVLIFSSDGLETLSWVQIQNFVRELLPRGVAAVADGLIKAVDGIGGNRNYQDNTTLVVVQADGGQGATRAVPIGGKEAAKTAPVAPKTTPIPAKAAPAGTISESARSGRWSPTKLLLGIVLGLVVVASVLFVTGRLGSLRLGPASVTAPTQAPAPAPAQEKGLRQQPAFTPESDSQLPAQRQRPQQEQPKVVPPGQGGEVPVQLQFTDRGISSMPSGIDDNSFSSRSYSSRYGEFNQGYSIRYQRAEEYCD
jgi:serine/threonine protein phosphatase PrpC